MQAVQRESALESPAAHVGKYELIRRLATGGMAEIHLARHAGIEGFEKLVVLKRILPSHARNDHYVSMFLDEARLAATLHHPNIVQVYDIGVEHGEYFFTMELVHGEDVRNIRKLCARLGKRLPLEHALNIVINAAAGLHAAHEQVGADGTPLGIVHRDVSPSNIHVSFSGCVKVLDFGVAKAGGRRAVTVDGALKGKITYMSPEQCRCEAVDRRSDVFALGNVLYQLTTGERPFRGDNEFDLIQSIGAGAVVPPSRATGGHYPFALETIVMKALAADPADRYPTAQDLQLDLEAFASGNGLRISAIELGAFMRDLFSEKLKLWELMERDATRLLAKRESERARLDSPRPASAMVTWEFDDLRRAESTSEPACAAQAVPADGDRDDATGAAGRAVIAAATRLVGWGTRGVHWGAGVVSAVRRWLHGCPRRTLAVAAVVAVLVGALCGALWEAAEGTEGAPHAKPVETPLDRSGQAPTPKSDQSRFPP